MNTQNKIILIGATFMIIMSILFFNISSEYRNEYQITQKEIIGINKIADMNKVDILLKNVRGINQLDSKDFKFLKKNLSIDDNKIMQNIKKLNDKDIEKSYKNIIDSHLSKMKLYQKYTKLLKLINNKRLDTADNSYLLFEANRDIYFSMIITVSHIANIMENIGKIRALGSRLFSNHTDKDIQFLLATNIKEFADAVDDIKYTINKLNNKEKNNFTILLDSITSDFYNLKIIVNNIKNGSSKLTPKEYFLQASRLVNKINSLFSNSKNNLTKKLKLRESSLRNKLLLGIIFYIFLMVLTIISIYFIYKQSNKDNKLEQKKKDDNQFIQYLQEDYLQCNNLKDMCSQSLNHIVNYFKATNGTLYLFDDENEKLYLGASYGIKRDTLAQTLDIHENLISENVLEKEIKIVDINQKINLGTIDIYCTKLVTIPIMEFEKSIGTIQLTFDENFNNVDIEFLTTTISLMGTYINKAQKDEEVSSYLKLIDKNVLISKTDLDGNIIEVSEHLCELSQYKKEELIGKTHQLFRHPDMDKKIFSDMWNYITKGKIWNGEIKNLKKDGSFYWIDITVSADKDINGNIIGYTAMRIDITDKKKIEQIAITDGLTSLYNRRHFDNIFPQQIDINKREKTILAFVLIDIDHFKQYNDTYGHQEGDRVLKLVAKVLKDTLKRASDYTFRLGGEEFGLLYSVKNEQNAIFIANQAKKNIENLNIEHTGNSASRFVTISSGLYIINSDDNSTVDEIYLKSDEALYNSKQNGRNQISIAKIH